MRILFPLAWLIVGAGLTACSEGRSAFLPTSPTVALATAAPQSVTRIRGYITDTASRPLSGVRVEILDGAAAGQSSLSGDDGYVLLTGAFDKRTRFQASKSGYETWTSTWGCSVEECPGNLNASPWLSFSLRPLLPPLELAGEYALTITADASCATLPPAARSRSYPVTVSTRLREGTADVLGYEAVIHDADVLAPVQRFGIGVAGNYLSIIFARGEGEVPGLIERLGENAYVMFTAWARGSVSQGTSLSLQLEGSIEYVTTLVPLSGVVPEPIVAVSRQTCASAEGSRLLLVRR